MRSWRGWKSLPEQLREPPRFAGSTDPAPVDEAGIWSLFDIIPNWNGREHLAHLLPSLCRLCCKEILIVDNDSSDGSQEFVRQHYPQVKILQNEINRGFSQPNNLAASHARGRYLAFINNDMRADEKWLHAALPYLNDKVPCLASRILDWRGEHIAFNGSSLRYLGYALQRDIGTLLKDVSSDNKILFPCGGAMLIDREIFLRLGGFDEDYFAIYEDVDLGWRLWITGYEVAFAPESIVYHRGHGTFKTHENEKMRYLMHRNALLTILKNYEEETFRKILPLAIILAIKRAILFSGVEKESFYLWAHTRRRLRDCEPEVQFRILDSLNHLVSLDDILQSMPQILQKRRKIQQSRKRRDSEILNLFVDPFRSIVDHPLYQKEESQYLHLLDLASLFDMGHGSRPCEPLAPLFERKIRDLQAQLKGWQWIGSQALMHPPSPSRNRPAQFLRTWRKEGFNTAWHRFLEYIERGI